MDERALRIRDAFKNCARHPGNEGILITADPNDIAAVGHPDCKAVIWQRKLAPEIQAVFGNLDNEKIALLNERCGQFKRNSRFDPHNASSIFQERGLFATPEDAALIGKDIENIAAHTANIPESYHRLYGWFHAKFSYTSDYHVDLISSLRVATVYIGRGFRYVVDEMADADYTAANTKNELLPEAYVEQNYTLDVAPAGYVIAYRTQNDGRRPGKFQGLVHHSPNIGASESRLFFGMDHVHPVYCPVT